MQVLDRLLRDMIRPRVPPLTPDGRVLVKPDFVTVSDPTGAWQNLHLARFHVAGGRRERALTYR